MISVGICVSLEWSNTVSIGYGSAGVEMCACVCIQVFHIMHKPVWDRGYLCVLKRRITSCNAY